MHPILFTVGATPVTSYGAALSLAFAVGIVVAGNRARARGVDREIIIEAAIVILITSLVGSRLLFAYEQPQLFMSPEGSWMRLFAPFLKSGQPGEMAGLSMSGGVVLAIASTLALLRFRGAPILRVTDVLAPSVALGEAITRIGCFLNGCCHGIVCEVPWGVVFPVGSPAWRAFGSVAVHPTQIYTSLSAFLIFCFLIGLSSRPWAHAREGVVFFSFLVLSTAMRLSVDLLRFDDVMSRSGSSWKPHQPLVLGLFALGVAGLAWILSRKDARSTFPS